MADQAGNGIYGGESIKTTGANTITGSLTVDNMTLDGSSITMTSGEDLNIVTSGGGEFTVNGSPVSGSGESNDLNDSVYNNDSGGLIAALTPVKSDGTGINTIDVSIEDDINTIVGITTEAIADSASGTVASDGRLENITTAIAVDSIVYISKTGGLTDTAPAIGVGGFLSGDFVVKLGVIVQNQSTPANKDIIIDIDVVGQL